MRTFAFTTMLTLAFVPLGAAAATVDVVIQAGHEGRPASCGRIAGRACNLGAGTTADREARWTSTVADAAAAALRAQGRSVARRPADYREHDTAQAYVAVHFDGAVPACASGASVGFPAGDDGAFGRDWARFYAARYPFRFAGENITPNEREYYGFRDVTAPHRMLVELGEITCPAQAAWLRPRLAIMGRWIADFVLTTLTAAR